MMYKTITKEGCMKNGYVCEFYPIKLYYDEETKKEQEYNPPIYRIKEATRPECWYCNRCKEKEKKDRYK